MPYPLLSTFYLLILICIICYYHLKNLGLTSLAYYHIVTINVLPKHALSSCLSGSLLSNVHHIICNSIMPCSTVYLDPFCLSLMFCNALSPIFFIHAWLPNIINHILFIVCSVPLKEIYIFIYLFYLKAPDLEVNLETRSFRNKTKCCVILRCFGFWPGNVIYKNRLSRLAQSVR